MQTVAFMDYTAVAFIRVRDRQDIRTMNNNGNMARDPFPIRYCRRHEPCFTCTNARKAETLGRNDITGPSLMASD